MERSLSQQAFDMLSKIDYSDMETEPKLFRREQDFLLEVEDSQFRDFLGCITDEVVLNGLVDQQVTNGYGRKLYALYDALKHGEPV